MNKYNGGNNNLNNVEVNKMRLFKLIVQPDENSITVLKYLDSSIKTLNQMGVKFKIVKIDPEFLTPSFLKELEQNNVTRLPVVITDDNKYWIGYKEIKSKIYTNIKLYQENVQKEYILNQQLNNDPMGLNNMLQSTPESIPNDYLSNEMKYLKKNGDKYEFDDDSEEEIGGKTMDLRKATEEQAKARQQNLDSKSTKGKKTANNKFVDDEIEIDFNPRKQNNSNNITPGFIKNNPELDNDDRDLLKKLGGGDYESMMNDDGESLFRAQAMSKEND